MTANEGQTLATGNENPTSVLLVHVKRFVMRCKIKDQRRLIHSIKVGIALLLVSLSYLINPMFKQLGENAIWAIMTVVVVFEFYAGATFGKGINRGIGTLLGGALGCLVASIADQVGGIAKPVIIAASIVLFSSVATYCGHIPRMKKRYEYGFRIFILTFNLVSIPGVRVDNVVGVARDRLTNIGLGFAICVVVSFLFFPIWASNDLHRLTASKFHTLADSVKGCFDEYFKMGSDKENQHVDASDYVAACKLLLHSKFKDESLANDAKWEPWHGKFGFHYPWDKYLEIGGQITQLASTLLALKCCLQSVKESPFLKMDALMLKDPFEYFTFTISWILKELGETIDKMEVGENKELIHPKLQSLKLQFTPRVEIVGENLAMATFNFNCLLVDIVDKVEMLANKVEELGKVAKFRANKAEV